MLFALFACSTETPTPAQAPPPPAPEKAAEAAPAPARTEGGWEPRLGETVDAAQAVAVDEVMAKAAEWSGKDLVLKGTIREVCQKKGCWHTIATADPTTNILVKDKEYGIFLPKDCAGKTALIKGTFSMTEMPEDEAKHYAEDAGRDPSTIHGPQKSYQMDADGVLLM